MQVVNITELVYSDPRPDSVPEKDAKHKRIMEGLNTPIYLGRITSLNYDVKSDRYSITCVVDDAKLNLKASNEVVEFAAAHMGHSGYWQGKMDSGVVVDVNLIRA